MNEQTRINATISYFFLGPLFLLAKKGTPLSEEFVQIHAKRSSIIVGITALIYGIYIFLKPYTNFLIPGIGIHIHTLILSIIIGGCIAFLIIGAYKAYHGITIENSPIQSPHFDLDIYGNTLENDELKVMVFASYIPLLGIFISKKNPIDLVIRGRIIGTTIFFISMMSIWLTGNGSFISFFLIIIFIIFFIIKGVCIFIYGRDISLSILDTIPSYDSIHAYIIATIKSIFEFFRIVFGGVERRKWSEFVYEELNREKGVIPDTDYFMPPSLLAIPFFNLFGIPSLFIEQYKGYRKIIIEGFCITLFWIYMFFFLGKLSHPFLIISFLPIVHIFVYGKESLSRNTPILSVIIWIIGGIRMLQSRIQDLKKVGETEKFQYK